MRNVPRVAGFEQQILEELQYRRAGVAGAARFDLLHNLRDCVAASKDELIDCIKNLEDIAQQLRIDVERRTTRGRSCPRCGGKIIPSRRAVYQSTGDPNDVFPSWQCERCGYEELLARPVKAAPKHGAPGGEAKAANTPRQTGTAASTATPSAIATQKAPAARALAPLKDRKGRALPPDVIRMMTEMNRTEGSKQ